MAQLQLTPPEPFDFKSPEEWPKWKRRFDRFRIASGQVRNGKSVHFYIALAMSPMQS